MAGTETTSRFHAELAWLGGDRPAANVLLEVVGEKISSVTVDVPAPASARHLPGLTVPGLVNTHSHVFHRAIRGHGQRGVATFWAWREVMYAVAGRLDPDSLYRLARATYAEMALSGITSVGEFFYLHHRPDGRPYDDANELGRAVINAAVDAGLRITLLDTCYLQAGINGEPLQGVQHRFDDRSWQAWAERVDALPSTPKVKIGAALHSVRAVPRRAMRPLAAYAADHGMPVHVHLSEQPAENHACRARYGLSPTELLRAEDVLGATTTAVHATHLGDTDIELLGETHTTISMCATTERDLADGVGPAARLLRAGSPLVLGTDAHMAIDLWEEARAVELDERLISGQRGHLQVAELLTALTSAGSVSLGWQAGRIEEGAPADLTTVRLDSPRTAGARSGDPLAHVVFAATASDVSTVVVGGQVIVDDGCHLGIPDTGRELDEAIAAVFA